MKPNNQPQELGRVRLPKKEDNEIFGIVTQLMGAGQVMASCEDGVQRNLRIPGKLKKRVWVREGDVIIVRVWDFQPSKGDVAWRYLGNQKEWLIKKGFLNKLNI